VGGVESFIVLEGSGPLGIGAGCFAAVGTDREPHSKGALLECHCRLYVRAVRAKIGNDLVMPQSVAVMLFDAQGRLLLAPGRTLHSGRISALARHLLERFFDASGAAC
jgi:hypothetical protein